MENIARGVLAGVAIGGFTAVLIKANLLAVKALLYFNALAVETIFEMSQKVNSQKLRQRVETIANAREVERKRERGSAEAEDSET